MNPPAVTGVSTRQMLMSRYSHQGDDIHFIAYNRNKKSMVIDLRSEKGRSVFYDLFSMIGYMVAGAANFEEFADPLPKMLWGAFKTGDGHIVLCGHRDGMWKNLAKALGKEAWLEDERYATISKGQARAEVIRVPHQVPVSRPRGSAEQRILTGFPPKACGNDSSCVAYGGIKTRLQLKST